MSKRYSGSSFRDKEARRARTGPHYAARNAGIEPRKEFAVGDKVRNTKTGEEYIIATKTSWGDYELKGINGYFSPKNLELITRSSK